MPQVKAAAVEDFRLLQELPQGPGAVTWLGRVGDGWYLLLQGTQRLLRRGDMTTPGSIWAPVQITDEMIAATEENDVLVNNMTELAEMLVKELSDRMTPPAVNQSVETRAYLMVVAHTLDEAEKLRAQTLDQVMAWREHRSTSEESARFIGEKINPPALELLRHFEIAPPEGMLQGLHNSMQTTLGCLCAGVALCERALWLNDPVRLQKGETLLADAERTGAKTRLKLDILHPGGS